MKMVQHGVGASTCVAKQFEAKDLGAPFKVFLHNAVKVTTDTTSGAIVSYSIPDLEGLVAEVVIERSLHPRKLCGAEIKFIRKAISLKQKDLAEKLDMSPEHFSRCETGALVMAPSSEKLLRIISVRLALKLHKMKSGDAKARIEGALDRIFDSFKPMPVFGIEDEIRLDFYRSRPSDVAVGSQESENEQWKVDAA